MRRRMIAVRKLLTVVRGVNDASVDSTRLDACHGERVVYRINASQLLSCWSCRVSEHIDPESGAHSLVVTICGIGSTGLQEVLNRGGR